MIFWVVNLQERALFSGRGQRFGVWLNILRSLSPFSKLIRPGYAGVYTIFPVLVGRMLAVDHVQKSPFFLLLNLILAAHRSKTKAYSICILEVRWIGDGLKGGDK